MAADVLKPNKVPLFANKKILIINISRSAHGKLAFVSANRLNCDVK